MHGLTTSPEGHLFDLVPLDSPQFPWHSSHLFVRLRAEDERQFPLSALCYYESGPVTVRGIVQRVEGQYYMEITRPEQISLGGYELALHSQQPIDWKQAGALVGQAEEVEGIVKSAHDSSSGYILVLADDNGQLFEVILVSLDIMYFRGLNKDPAEYYPGLRIRATGLIVMRNGRPAMLVTNNCLMCEIDP